MQAYTKCKQWNKKIQNPHINQFLYTIYNHINVIKRIKVCIKCLQSLTFSIAPSSSSGITLSRQMLAFSFTTKLGSIIILVSCFSHPLSFILLKMDELNWKSFKYFTALKASRFLCMIGDLKWVSSFFFGPPCPWNTFVQKILRFREPTLLYFDGKTVLLLAGVGLGNIRLFFMILFEKFMCLLTFSWIIGMLTEVKITGVST